MTGQSIGPYRVTSRIGSGETGEVFLAEGPGADRQVAVRCLSDAWLGTPDTRDRLQRDLRAVARLSHPNIAAIYDVFEHEGRPCIVMEYVAGESLASRLRHGPVPVGQAVEIAIQVGEALAEAHAQGVVHRDLKPANISLTPRGPIKVLDFGLGPGRADRKAPASGASLEAALAEAGERPAATVGYTAPELLSGGNADQRSDLFAVGAVLFELVTGRRPFERSDPTAEIVATLTEPVPAARDLNSAVPVELNKVITRALQKNPGDRFSSAAELSAALDRIRHLLRERATTALVEQWAPANPPVPRPKS